MTHYIKRFVAVGALSVALAAPVAAQDWIAPQDWQASFDLITAGAAASVILHHLCDGADSGALAADYAAKRLINESAMINAVSDATQYARESYRLKLKAFEQTSSGQSCASLSRLFDIASATGFPVPRR